MRAPLVFAFASSLVVAPAAARADIGGCLAGPNDLNRCSVSGTPAAVLGAVAVPVIIAGAAVSVAHELARHVEERAADETRGASATKKHAPPSLALVPDPPDPYRARAGRPEARRPQPNGAFVFNETATNIAAAVTGAAVVGAVIATIVHDAHHK